MNNFYSTMSMLLTIIVTRQVTKACSFFILCECMSGEIGWLDVKFLVEKTFSCWEFETFEAETHLRLTRHWRKRIWRHNPYIFVVSCNQPCSQRKNMLEMIVNHSRQMKTFPLIVMCKLFMLFCLLGIKCNIYSVWVNFYGLQGIW